MNAVRPAQLASVHLEGNHRFDPETRVNDLACDRCKSRAFNWFRIGQLEQQHPCTALFQLPDQLLDPLRVGPNGIRRIFRIELLQRAVRIDPVVEIARRLPDQLAQIGRDLSCVSGA